ncbi:N-acetylglucosamine kinase [Pedobacter cryophilus]|uniref:N-acetylglucosamine kinase n=1 Tax=Pedobacter cryophilus TaxID=2571271 RepID=A0A4U1C268_9SPHI|nr:N-acetylglucosamine kinase [Pedobacter cryophilus]TKB99205.1 N-acetylglucosamine kinase [Pedobacter cryophilus]
MILVADSGSTKTSWCLKSSNNNDIYFDTEGYNPYYLDSSYIVQSITSSLPNHIQKELISEVNFYGAGCSEDKVVIVEEALRNIFPKATISVELDLLAAARSVLGHSSGFVGILGTGTNSCLYDGKKITHQIDSLGFIIGDEGSGAYLGKQLLIAYSRGFLPEDLKRSFWKTYELTPSDIISEIYTSRMPNRFCAGFCKFINNHVNHPFIIELVKASFRDFFKNIVTYYPDYSKYTFNCIGSIAFNFLPLLNEVAQEFDMKIGNIIKSPIEGLVKYHNLTVKED